MTTQLLLADVLAVNNIISGHGVRDIAGVDAAVARPMVTVGGEDAYPTVWVKAAALFRSLARNHGFIDGNKRTAWVATMVFLELNGHPAEAGIDVDAAEELVLAVATGQMTDVGDIAHELASYAGH